MSTVDNAGLSVITPSDREIVMTRVFNAPRRLVFDAWTKPELLARWMLGPSGWTMPVCEIDLRVGGKYLYTWRSQTDGSEFSTGGEYREIDPPRKLVYTWAWESKPGIDTVVTVEFLDRGTSTEVVLTHTGFPEEAARARHEQGWTGCLANLEKALAGKA